MHSADRIIWGMSDTIFRREVEYSPESCVESAVSDAKLFPEDTPISLLPRRACLG
jgi:hypothetical protein